ncbi:VOC family protein [Ornithinimicrobium sp. INDO-MA30-4]|uniref:VOC family protein n=1 Tax=Ornithinimicrobium sp. INDO-MA30-4 TaxID=2908651 RepID=UPI001F36375C|nr:VOC family protein [Ornithinimicrobium sp. INDO-MA30-4]UJH70144.1 VOC family protein [Ornithinimicrobium sp. INDO-MA30-4]
MSSRIAAIAIDAEQPGLIARFWCDVLGWHITEEHNSIVSIAAPDGVGPTIDVLVVPESKSVKNRIHLDLTADSPSAAGELERLLALGARPTDVGQDADESWVVLSDPEGNEFCLLAVR